MRGGDEVSSALGFHSSEALLAAAQQDEEGEDATYDEARSVQLRRDKLILWVNEVFFSSVVEVLCFSLLFRPLPSTFAPPSLPRRFAFQAIRQPVVSFPLCVVPSGSSLLWALRFRCARPLL